MFVQQAETRDSRRCEAVCRRETRCARGFCSQRGGGRRSPVRLRETPMRLRRAKRLCLRLKWSKHRLPRSSHPEACGTYSGESPQTESRESPAQTVWNRRCSRCGVMARSTIARSVRSSMTTPDWSQFLRQIAPRRDRRRVLEWSWLGGRLRVRLWAQLKGWAEKPPSSMGWARVQVRVPARVLAPPAVVASLRLPWNQ